MSMIRSFIALDLSESVKRGIGQLQQELQKVDAPVSWVKCGSIHLTLKFLGNISPEQIPDIQKVLGEIASTTSAFRLQAQGCGAFPSLKQMRVVWVGLQGDREPLGNLQRKVDAALVQLGFEAEDRPFKPHLTIGRVKGKRHLLALQEALLARTAFETEAFDVKDVVLYKSELRREGALYTPLFRAGFAQDFE